MSQLTAFEHLPLVLRTFGAARLTGGGEAAAETKAAKNNRGDHVEQLAASASAASSSWWERQTARDEAGSPPLPSGVPLLLRIDPNLELDEIRKRFAFEIISEEKDGFVIVASEDIDLGAFLSTLEGFTTSARGSAAVASIHELREDPTQGERLNLILSEMLVQEWGTMEDDQEYICDIGIACTGVLQIPLKPKRGRRREETWQRALATWETARREALDSWDDLHVKRYAIVQSFVEDYGGKLLDIVHDEPSEAGSLPDSFTVRIRVVGKGLRDLVLNCAYVFEVVEPDDFETPQALARRERNVMQEVSIISPAADAPAICVIDSGIQEEHFWLRNAIDSGQSLSLVPNQGPADQVQPGGHGTRVAGAALYGTSIPTTGRVHLEHRLQNSRVLDQNCKMPDELFPPLALRETIEHFGDSEPPTRIFNQSINADAPCRTKHMSAWAAEIDRLSYDRDILLIQSAGNLSMDRIGGGGSRPGIRQWLQSGKRYPDYLSESGCRIANPAQSFQALTVGSVASRPFSEGGWTAFASEAGEPSAFSRVGFGLWNSIKPEVVEYGGDCLYDTGDPPSVGTPTVGSTCYPELLRATHSGGPAMERDDVGTSFAAPLVAKLAAELQQRFPELPCLIYRALIVQSAKWPEWARRLSHEDQTLLLSRIGYGIPDAERATGGSTFRATFITDETNEIHAAEAHIFQVRVPELLRRVSEEHDIRIDVTLSYAAEPRRTRRTHRGYLSVWLDWIASRSGEPLDAFEDRALKTPTKQDRGSNLRWTIGRQGSHGILRGVRQSVGTVQKDWAVVPSHNLPADLCLAVRGHKGWSYDPESTAKYVLTVTFESEGQEIEVYEPLRAAAVELQAEVAAEIEAETAAEVEVEIESE